MSPRPAGSPALQLARSARDRFVRTGPLIRTHSRTVYTWFVLATPLAAAAFSLVHMVRSVFIPYELAYGEGLVLWQSLRITSPQTVYHAIDTYPFVVGMYPPAFLLTTHLVGAAIGDIQIGGRLVALIATVGCAAMISAIVLELLPLRFDRWARWTGALTAGALVLNLANVRRWAPLARVDLPAIALCLAGLFLFLNGRRPGWKWFAAFGCFALAAFTKQSLVAAPAACLAAAAFQSRRTAFALAGFYAVLLVASFGAMQVITDGQFLKHLFVYTTQNRFDILQVFVMGGRNLGAMSLLLIPACLAAWIPVRRPRAHQAASRIRVTLTSSRFRWGIGCLVLYVVVAAIVSTTSGKNGAGPYY